MNAEETRLAESRERTKHWKRWGTYVSERAWGTVREDYSESGAACGNTFRLNKRINARIAGTKTASPDFATGIS